jgi:hypothetical protein
MAADNRESFVEPLVRKLSGLATPTAALIAARREIEDISSSDYRKALRRCFSRQEVCQILRTAKKRVWPNLNQVPVRLVSLDEFVRRWSVFGVELKFARLSWQNGSSLLGFYVPKTEGLRSPLIFVNTAHHPALVGLALDHEMGHHLTSSMFAVAKEMTHRLAAIGFKEHLADPVELAADTLVSFGILPAPLTRRLYEKTGSTLALSDEGFAKTVEYIANRYSVRIELIHGVRNKFQALAALLHYMKLRHAVMDEYSV